MRKPVRASSAQRGHGAASVVDGKRDTCWMPRELPASLEIDLRQPTTFNIVMLQEYIAEGQHVEEYSVEALTSAGWQEIKRGTTIGHKKLDRVVPVTATRVKINILRSRALPLIRNVSLYHAPEVKTA